MYLQTFANTWETDISLYFSDLNRVISTSNQINSEEIFRTDNYGNWEFYENGDNSYFRLLFNNSHSSDSDLSKSNLLIEVRMYAKNLINLLKQNKTVGLGDLFIYTDSDQYIATPDHNAEVNKKIVQNISNTDNLENNYHQFEFNYKGENLQVSYFYIPILDAYLIDYIPIEQVLLPISESKNLFIISLSALLLLAGFAFLLLYRNVQQPIKQLVTGLSTFETGSYSFRINKKYNNEFDYLISRFNQMGEKIQHLVEDIYEEQNRVRLASIKQLQSQINPHFLYNSLSFISSCTKIGAKESVIKMTHHLADYYRYTTEVENQSPTLKEEIKLIEHYLEIYKIRSERLEFIIDIPEDMLQQEFLRLTLQPIVENAVIHGVETNIGKGFIKIKGYQKNHINRIYIADNGVSMSNEKMERIQKNLDKSIKEGERVGLHNVHKRLKYHFGEGSGISFTHSEYGGLCVTLQWQSK